ncbi:MAG: hypothetical protein AMXMBFR58_34280 [Phycisphaerae bacterium]
MTTRQTSRYSCVPGALARTAIGPALILALIAGSAVGQASDPRPAGGPIPTPRSSTADAASSMVPDRATLDQGKKKVGQDDAVAGDIKVDANQIVDLHVKDEELTRVLELLAIQSQRNIIPTKSVNAQVSANLYGVTFYEALDALLHPNGFGWMERSNRIEVYTLEELKQIEASTRTRVAKVIKLNYLNAVDAGAFVEALLSEGGQIKTNGKTPGFNIPDNTPVGQDDYANDSMLVVYDFEENVAEIERLIREIDTRPSQVLVEATILQTQLNEANAFGVDFSVLGDLNFVDFSGNGGPLSAVNSLISGKSRTLASGEVPMPADGEGRAVVSSPGNTSGPGTLKIGLVDSDVAVFIKMLDEVGDTTIISNPKVLALNRQSARVLVGRKVGYLNTTSTDTTTTQSVEFLDTGTQLYFRPFVTNEGLIRLELKPVVSEAVIRDAKDATGAAVTIPDEITNEIVTNVLVRDGQTVVLGGLFRESTESSRRQVPFLGDIPLLGAAFRGHDDSTTRNEIIFMIKPSIVSDQVLVMQGERGSELVDRVRTGSRESLLPWSREKMSGQNLVEAERLAAEGKDTEALWKIQQSLSMNHNQPEAIALREKLSNKKDRWPGRSMLESIVNDEAQGATTAPAAPGASAAPKATPPADAAGMTQTTQTSASQTFNPQPADTADAPASTGTPAGDAATNQSSDQSTDPSTDQATDQEPTASATSTESTPASVQQDEQGSAPTDTVATNATGDSSQFDAGQHDQASTADTQVGEASGDQAQSDQQVTGAGLSEFEMDATASAAAMSEHNGVEAQDPAFDMVENAVPSSQDQAQPQYITAWAWFFSGFGEFWVPGPAYPAFPGPVQASTEPSTQPASGEQSTSDDTTVSNASSDSDSE